MIYASPMYPNDLATPELADNFDQNVVSWATTLGTGDVEGAGKQLLSNFPIVDEAKACGWTGFLTVQACMEAEAPGRSWGGQLQGYSHPTYFGMMCATFVRSPDVSKALAPAAAGGSGDARGPDAPQHRL